MTSEVRASIVIDRPTEQVWRYLNDPANDSDWRPVRKLHSIDGASVGAGTSDWPVNLRSRRQS
jgi:uncharacterized protein YndB with AHSA1/START domain